MNYIHRAIEDTFLRVQSEYSVTLLTGPRQVGKTTMLQRLMQGTNRKYVTLDDLNARALASDPDAFFQIYSPPVLIDEIQYAPQLFSQIKLLADASHRKGDFWITGSQSYRLMQGVSESLAGRIAILEMHSLSQSEISGNDNFVFSLGLDELKSRAFSPRTIPEIFDTIFRGGMPELVSGGVSDIDRFYKNYIRSYIERDVKYLSSEIDGLLYFNFIKSVAARIGQVINVADIARDVGINEVAAKRWLAILETLGIIFFLHPYSNNALKRALKKPKLYFFDTALAVNLLGWGSPSILLDCAMNGAYFENFVISEIWKSWLNAGLSPAFYYYRDKEQREIDLIIEKNACLHPIEIKKAAAVNKVMVSSFSALKPAVPFTIGTGAVVCNAMSLSAIDSDTLIIPASLI